MTAGSAEEPAVAAARVAADASRDAADRAARASEKAASWAFKGSALASSLTLVGVVITSAFTLAGHKDDIKPASNDSCTVRTIDTAQGIDAYDKLLKTGKITIQQRQRLVDDAIADQVNDVKVSCAKP